LRPIKGEARGIAAPAFKEFASSVNPFPADLVSRKVAHVVQKLDHGAVENWLVRMLRFGREHGIAMDWTFYCNLGQPGRLDEEVRSLGARVVHSPVPIGNKFQFVRALRQELWQGRYDVLHCHHDLVSALYLVAALGVPITQRIVHIHNADESVLTPNTVKRLLYPPILRKICLSTADRIVAISNHTLDTFLAGRERRAERDFVLYYGVDQSPFERARADRQAFRRQLGLPTDTRLLLFAGRMVPEKNPIFAVDVLAEMRRLDQRVVGVFVGTGSLDAAIRAQADRRGLGDSSLRQLGWRDDLAEIMTCCDWFILPRPESPPEGFGLTIVEAQLAGLRLLLSRGIPDDPLLPRGCFQRLGLSEGPRAWAKAAMDMMAGPAPSRANASADLKNSPMHMPRALGALLTLHNSVVGAKTSKNGRSWPKSGRRRSNSRSRGDVARV
jgi:glycosyltransferase involved in cell wall biosynthesis